MLSAIPCFEKEMKKKQYCELCQIYNFSPNSRCSALYLKKKVFPVDLILMINLSKTSGLSYLSSESDDRDDDGRPVYDPSASGGNTGKRDLKKKVRLGNHKGYLCVIMNQV